MAVKEAKSNPWALLKAQASKADKPSGGKSWNSRKNGRKEGDVLIGTLGAIRDTITDFGPGKVQDVLTPDGKLETVFLSKVLEGAFIRAGFKEGDKVFVKYLGVPKGKRYSTFAVGKV